MTHSFLAYIDESGDDGVDPDLYRQPGARGGQSCWLVLSACIIRSARDKEVIGWRDQIIQKIGKQKRDLHFAELQHNQKIVACQVLGGKFIRGISVLSHKITIPADTYTQKNQLYFYLTRYLVERISWFCRDHRNVAPEGDGTVKITFSRRGGMSCHDFREYLGKLKEDNSVQIHWPVIDIDSVDAKDHSTNAGLQLADCVASAFGSAVEHDKFGNCESRYTELLKPVIYRRENNYLSYGVKLVPKYEDAQLSEQQSRLIDLYK
ncbi:hypothetical protein BN961_01925 [Afipia felis]|uniref:DUF3800 domain-containing protein n=1 Tax=Afipia felis TaxID=1035 RepID=A0A090MSC2_AFIFE|nr:DUF3800 domain-containing protein [Afipia felis]CEG08509.1 hypothetical protein BN961_01925 [Afipia felis]